ncbi:hypothetical protein T439DRAFT_324531 [Meredithblackwellia eburnea MCA 4105]
MDDAVGWIVALSISFVAFRYLFGGGGDGASGATPRRRRQVPQAQIDQVTSMFPHVSVASVRYELERTGDVQGAVDRILRDGALPEPPAGFFVDPSATPAPPPVQAAPPATHTPAPSSSSSATPATPASLIQRLGLQHRAVDESGSGSASVPSTPDKGKGKVGSGWEATPEARERNLRERKEKMVLEARRKLLEKERAKAAGESPRADRSAE